MWATSSGTNKFSPKIGNYDEPAARNALFQIRLNRANQVKVFEVDCEAASLNSNDTFILVLEGESEYGFAENR